jgi:hypothetical protein
MGKNKQALKNKTSSACCMNARLKKKFDILLSSAKEMLNKV